MKESLSGFSFECDSRKEFAGQNIRLLLYWLSGLWFSLSVIVDQRIFLKFWRVDIY